MSDDDVYIVTLQFDSVTCAWLQTLRSRHFPPNRNWIPAHLTLFHAISTDQVGQLKREWPQFDRFARISIRFSGYRSLGRGTALTVESGGLHEIRSLAKTIMAGAFSRQDEQPFNPHVTIQNKVEPRVAKSLLADLSASFVAREGTGLGLVVWRYLGGPWSLDESLPFKETTARPP